jgi:hypothetical protein
MSYIVDRVLLNPTVVEAPIDSSDPANLWSGVSIPDAALRDLVVYVHNPAGSGANVFVCLVAKGTATTAYDISSATGLTFPIAPGDTIPIGIRRGAAEIFLAGDGAAVDTLVTIASVTGVQAC